MKCDNCRKDVRWAEITPRYLPGRIWQGNWLLCGACREYQLSKNRKLRKADGINPPPSFLTCGICEQTKPSTSFPHTDCRICENCSLF